MRIQVLASPATPEELEGLAELLRDAVAGNASIGFTEVPEPSWAAEWWASWLAGGRVTWAAFDELGMAGTVSLVPSIYPNGVHRAEVAKLLVHRRARRGGVASRLMAALEAEALARGRTTLVLDTETGSAAEMLYQGLGWTAAGSIPRFCSGPDGRLTPTTYYYKHLG